MNNLFKLFVLAGLIYGGYQLFEYITGDSIDRVTKEVTGGQLKRGRRAIALARGTMNQSKVGEVRDAVRLFKTQNERNPVSLQELVDEGFLGNQPAGVVYDPETGEVSAG